MTPPNLFSFATSELTQDAFLAYLLAWANPAVANHDPAMHRAGTAFLRLLLDLHGKPLKTVKQLVVRAQVKNIDVLVYLETEEDIYTLVIEDKVHAGSYNKLKKYLAAAKSVYPKAEPLGIYLRTGNQADYAAIKEENLAVYQQIFLPLGNLPTLPNPANPPPEPDQIPNIADRSTTNRELRIKIQQSRISACPSNPTNPTTHSPTTN